MVPEAALGAAPQVPAAPVRSLYVHVPFCSRQCGYCDFAIHVGRLPDGERWTRVLQAEWRRVRDRTDLGPFPLETVYVGGGTPSLLGPELPDMVRAVLDRPKGQVAAVEWTIEANPEQLASDTLTTWVRAGVNRVSIGVQSFHEPTLRWMGRLHGQNGAERAIEAARRAGLRSWSLDLMFGLPGSRDRDWSADLDRALRHEPPHLSLYGLSVEEGTPLDRRISEGRESPPDESRYANEYLEAVERLLGEGYEHYEVSSFARPGHRAVHNARYWTGEPYLGLGNGAHSYEPPVRSWNLREWSAYAEAVEAGADPRASSERVTGSTHALERLWLDLRRREGVTEERIDPGVVARWIAQGWAERVQPATLRMTPQGWLRLDDLAAEASAAERDG